MTNQKVKKSKSASYTSVIKTKGSEMKVSRHGSKRIKKRVGLPKRAHLRHIQSVLKHGDVVTKKTSDGFKMIYHGFLYIFATNKTNEPILVTTYETPNEKYIKLSDFRSENY